jgi:hypothetical protein
MSYGHGAYLEIALMTNKRAIVEGDNYPVMVPHEVDHLNIEKFSSFYAHTLLDLLANGSLTGEAAQKAMYAVYYNEFLHPQVDPCVVGLTGETSWFKQHMPDAWLRIWHSVIKSEFVQSLELDLGKDRDAWQHVLNQTENLDSIMHMINHTLVRAKDPSFRAGFKSTVGAIQGAFATSDTCEECQVVRAAMASRLLLGEQNG